MKIEASKLIGYLNRIKSLGSAKLNSNNILINNSSENVRLSVTSNDMYVVLETNISIEKEDSFFFEGSIAVDLGTIQNILQGMKDNEIEIGFSKKNENYLSIISPSEDYELHFNVIEDKTTNPIFNPDVSNYTTLIKEQDIVTLSPISKMIENIDKMAVDNKFKTIIHRENNKLNCVFITSSTLNAFNLDLSTKDEYTDAVCGFETKSSNVPLTMLLLLSNSKESTPISMSYNDNNIFYQLNDSYIKCTYKKGDKDVTESFMQFTNIKTNIENTDTQSLVINAPTKDLHRMISKSAMLLGSNAKQLDSYTPLKIYSEEEIGVEFKSSTGSYNSKIKDQVKVEGLNSENAGFDMSIPIIGGMLDTLNKSFKNSVTQITLKKTTDDKTFLSMKDANYCNVEYHMRLKSK